MSPRRDSSSSPSERPIAVRDGSEPGSAGTLVFPTVRFGDVTVGADTLLHFPRGIVGFPDARRFVFLHAGEAQGPIYWLQSVDDPSLAFLVCELEEDLLALGILESLAVPPKEPMGPTLAAYSDHQRFLIVHAIGQFVSPRCKQSVGCPFEEQKRGTRL